MDYSIGAKGYKKKEVEKYNDFIDDGSSYVVSMAYLIKKRKLKIVEIPTKCFDKRKSKFNLTYEIFYRLRSLLSFWFKVKFLKIIK